MVPAVDPNERVAGGGLQKLRDAGIRVDSGLMVRQAGELNPGFLKRMKTGRPWVRVKSAVSLDGRIGLRNGESKWITGDAARADVQRWRARSSAILTGIGTVLADDPEMKARVAGPVNQPLRVVADSAWRIPRTARLLEDAGTVLVAGGGEAPRDLLDTGANCVSSETTRTGIELEFLLDELGRRELNEVQVEAGSRLCGALLARGLVDEVLLYMAPVMLGDGGPGPFSFGPLDSMTDRAHFSLLETVRVGDDTRLRLKPHARAD